MERKTIYGYIRSLVSQSFLIKEHHSAIFRPSSLLTNGNESELDEDIMSTRLIVAAKIVKRSNCLLLIGATVEWFCHVTDLLMYRFRSNNNLSKDASQFMSLRSSLLGCIQAIASKHTSYHCKELSAKLLCCLIKVYQYSG